MTEPTVAGLSDDRLAELLADAVIVPVLRTPTADDAIRMVATCVDAGLTVVELTATTSGWSHAVAEVRTRWPHVWVGVGTVLTAAEADRALAEDAQFLVTPCPAPEVRAAADRRVPLVEGGFTPGEILAAARLGVAKMFPAHVGGPQMLRSVLAVRPQARVVPTGGIALADVPTWIQAGALAVGVGSDLFRHGDLRAALAAIRAT